MRRLAVAAACVLCAVPSAAQSPERQQILDTMKRATRFMVEKVSTEGGYVWAYLPDLSRRWGELEARKTQIWIQPPGTPTMGQVFLDAFHATGDEYYYRAAEGVGGALIKAQHPSGGWNYLADFAGDRSLRQWYASIGRNAWRLEEFQHDWGNATFDDGVTGEATRFLLRLYAEKRDPKYRPPLDRAIRFVLDSQYPVGAWPQRYPNARPSPHEHLPEYPAYITFNDGVTAGNVDLLVMCYQVLGDVRLLDPIRRGMHAFVVTQQRAPQAGWALQYTRDLKPAGARTYEPAALSTHTTAANAAMLLKFYRLTGDTAFLARVTEALDWLDAVRVPPQDAAIANGGTHPTFIEVGTNRPLYVHRTGSNVVNGRYYVDYDPRHTIGHYGAFRRLDVADLRKRYEEARALPPSDAVRDSPIAPGAPRMPLPRYVMADAPGEGSAAEAVSGLNAEGYWPAPLRYTSHPYRSRGSAVVAPGDFSQTHVGDDTDTSPFPDDKARGISTGAYIRQMSVLIRALDRDPVERRTAAAARQVTWARGVEAQRKADLGNGSFLNPIVAGDHPDPSILKDGVDYYMTFSSFDAYPGLVIWHSRDLVNWQPLASALQKNVGSVWAPDLVKHQGRYYIYFPARTTTYRSNYVITADAIGGPWSDPIDLKIGQIDPGHAVGPDGRRYLFLSGGYVVPLAADGLSVSGEMKKVYDGWQYPKDWIVESFAQEGPKILRKGAYYYQVLAEGGTAGPPTGHMIVAARSKTIEGPWENSPYNPIVRTRTAAEHWWSKGHGTLVEGPDRRWWIVYHAYENGFYNLGRQTLLQPVEWLEDGWFRVSGNPDEPIAKPVPASAGPHGFAFSDDFSTNKMGIQWSFYKGTDADRARYRYERGSLVLKAKGTTPADSSPLWFVTGDHAYEFEVEIERDPGATGGVLLFYNQRLYVGLGFSARDFIMHSYGIERPGAKPPGAGAHLFFRVRNDRHIVTIDYSTDGKTWERFDRGMEVSGYHHNVGYDFLSLRPALYAAGAGEVRFRNFKYRALP